MANSRKKQYMKQYNQKPEVKEKKAAYMRKIRAQQDKKAAEKVVRTFLDFGYEDLAEEFARERAPELLLTIKSKSKHKA